MDIRKQLTLAHSKQNAEHIASYIGDDASRFEQLISIFLGEDDRLCQRSAMAVSKCVDRYPSLLAPHLEKIILNLQGPVTVAVKRNSVRVLQTVEIPEDLLGIAAEILFGIMENRQESIAVRVFTMTVLYNICVRIPELSNELKLIIEDQMPYGSTGYRNRGAKTIARLEQLIKLTE